MRMIYTDGAPAPTGHRSQAIVHGDMVYVSGQLPIDPRSGKPATGSMQEQAALALKNVEEILKKAASGLENVLKLTVYITDIGDWKGVDAVFAEKFGGHKPARSVIAVKELHHDTRIQIEATAFIPEQRVFWH